MCSLLMCMVLVVCVGDVLISKRIHELRKILMWQLNKIRRRLF